jgi:hypothetical protein
MHRENAMPIESPDDLEPAPDLDFPAEQADRENDAAAIGYAPRIVVRPMSRAEFSPRWLAHEVVGVCVGVVAIAAGLVAMAVA